MVKQDQSNQQGLLERLYGAFVTVPYKTGSDGAQLSRGIFDNISKIIDEFGKMDQCSGIVDGNAIFYSRANSTLYCKINIEGRGRTYQEYYERDELSKGYRLHVFGVEGERGVVGGIDLIVGLVDNRGVPLYIESFYYKTNNRLLYDRLVYQISEKLKEELTPYLLKSGSVSPIELKRIIDNVTFSIISMGDKPLKEIKLRFKNAS